MTLRCLGLTAAQAAAGVGHSGSTLCGWAEEVESKSRRWHRVQPKAWTKGPVGVVERLRDDNLMWGKSRIAVLLAREGT